MGFRVIRLTDPGGFKQWSDAVAALPVNLQDIHFSAGYAAAQQYLDVEPVLAVYEAHGYRVVQPFALRKVSVGGIEAMDVANLYGYGGPASDHSWQLYAWFHEALMTWFRDVGIVSEFCALNPMLGEHQRKLISGKAAMVERKPVVVIDLTKPEGSGYRADRRHRIKHARNAGVKVMASGPDTMSRYNTFVTLYDETMRRRLAAGRWRFSPIYLNSLCKLGTMFFAEVDGQVECASLMLTSQSGDAYYHLTANAMLYPKAGANDLLVHEMANHARGLGMKRLHLGGGVTSAPDDSVLTYKCGFSDIRLPTYSYFRVFDDTAYRNLCLAKISQEKAETGAEFASGFLPLYRRDAS